MLPDLLSIKQDLSLIHEYLISYGKCQTVPPLIDSAFEHEHGGEKADPLENILLSNLRDPIPGLRIFRETIRRDIELLDKFISRDVRADSAPPSTNALYLVAVWNELVRAPLPVLFLDKTFPLSLNGAVADTRTSRKTKKSAGVKVDIVASGGERWIRVNTTKNSRLLVEFREQDSYLTDSDSDDGNEPGLEDMSPRPSSQLDNSVLRMGRSLLEAAKASVSGNTQRIPRITLRLTRLIPDSASFLDLQRLGMKIADSDLLAQSRPDTDARVASTIRELLKMGLDVELGELPLQKMKNVDLTANSSPKHFFPSRQINVDLSVLLALISDIAHAPLPASLDEARMRYNPTTEERERSRLRREKQKQLLAALKVDKGEKNGRTADEVTNPGESDLVYSASQLGRQIKQEMDVGFIEGIRRRLDSGLLPMNGVDFWTTRDARDRCLRIVEKIGGPKEKQRANALFWGTGPRLLLGPDYDSIDEAQEAYWGNSRYTKNYVPLIPIRLLDDATHPPPSSPDRTSFLNQLEHSCRRLLSQGFVDHPRALPDNACQITSLPEEQADPSKQDYESSDGEIQRAPVMKTNPRLTVHTVDTLLCGAVRGWTTLTSNRSSVREILKESFRENIQSSAGQLTEIAAIWLVEPRSLAEGMRSDFVPV